jgi:glyoxylase-like metal-dependent hydrolase (beta-lactamase superfamily II)
LETAWIARVASINHFYMQTKEEVPVLDAATLQQWLADDREVVVLDVRPLVERKEWIIPGSIHFDVYEQLKAGQPHVFASLHLPKQTPIVTVCTAGKVSQIAARQLVEEGHLGYSLSGGMKAWSQAWNLASWTLNEKSAIVQIRRTGKGCLSYLIGSDGEAIVIDPSVEAEVYGQLAAEQGWKIKYVLETHLHADHLSRARSLAQLTGATLVLPQGDPRKFPFQPIGAGQSVEIGKLVLQALATPGHTDHSFSYYLKEGFLFTGDTLFNNGIGRPDLHAQEGESRSRAAALYDSLQQLVALPDATRVLPGHISQPVPFDSQLLAASLLEIKQKLPVLSLNLEEFVNDVLSRIPATPPNYTAITQRNLNGDDFFADAMELEAGANRCAVS